MNEAPNQGFPFWVPDPFQLSAGTIYTSLYWCTDTWYIGVFQCYDEGKKEGEEEEAVEEQKRKKEKGRRKKKKKKEEEEDKCSSNSGSVKVEAAAAKRQRRGLWHHIREEGLQTICFFFLF